MYNVLLVEDNLTQQKLITLLLSKRNYIVSSVDTVELALNKLKSFMYDVIVLDLSLPDSHGLATLQRVQQYTQKTPIVVLTGVEDESLAIQALQLGAQEYLIKGKPSDDSIYRCLRYAIERADILNKLKRIEFFNSSIIDCALDPFISIDTNGIIKNWNKQAEFMLGWMSYEIIGENFIKVLRPQSLGKNYLNVLADFTISENINQRISKRFEIIISNKNNQELPVEVSLFNVWTQDTHFYCLFLRDITDKLAFQDKIANLTQDLENRFKEKTQELLRSNEELKQFAKIASHDLQEPLRVIQGYTKLLSKRYKGKLDKDADEFMAYITNGTERMIQLIQAVLRHSRVTQPQKQIKILNFKQIINDVLVDLGSAIAEKNVDIIYDTFPDIEMEEVLAIQLFQNLIGNALKYSQKDHSIIKIYYIENNNEYIFTIEDNGIGIDSKYFKKVFDMFCRVHNPAIYSGSGMGLAICKKIVESYGGRIWVESEVDQGTKFNFTFPRKK